MDFNTPILGRYVRIVAILALFVGLGDAARLLTAKVDNPIAVLGTAGFVYLSIFATARLFAAVGLWIRASWGAVLLLAASVVELGLYFLGNRDIPLAPLDFAVRLVLLVAISLLFVTAYRFRQRAE